MSTISVVQYQNTSKVGNILQQSQSGNTTFILRKPPLQQDILLTNPKKKHKVAEKTTNPPPVAVARRNARERNRVKQVNNGFATLRQHIPNSIAAAFESSSGRGGNKKLSKVETLRMAVEYIRSLEDLLAGDDSDNIHPNISSSSTSSSTPSSPNINTTTTNIYTYSNIPEDDDLSIHSQSPHQNYTTRNYQIITNYYDDSENLEPLTDIDLGNQDLSLLNSSLSPEMYSDDSLSPIADRQTFIPVFGHSEDVKLRMSPELMTDIKTEPPVLSLDNDNDLPTDSKENMIQVMAWWEQQQVRS